MKYSIKDMAKQIPFWTRVKVNVSMFYIDMKHWLSHLFKKQIR